MSWGLAGVRVSFGRRAALASVTVPVDPSRITVVVGGDGAGKSTCLKALVGLVEPDAGTVSRPAKEQIGYVPATAGLYQDLTVQENLDFSADAFRIPAGQRQARQAAVLERVGLTAARHRLGGQLSGGMQRKLAVGLALLHSPEMLVLDEPTTGVDPVSRAQLWRLISGAAARGTAVAVATTYVNEAARGSSVVLLEAGEVLASGSPDSILRSVPGALGTAAGAERPAPLSWRRGIAWRVWAPGGVLPGGVQRAAPDFEDAVVVASLAGEAGRLR